MRSNITSKFKTKTLAPTQAIVIFRKDDSIYVESYDIDENGKPINAHPLSTDEGVKLSTALSHADRSSYLVSKGVLPENILFIDQSALGHAVWYTPPMEVGLFFKKELTIPSGLAHIPGLVWKASSTNLTLFALKSVKKPTSGSPLYFAPFFNISTQGLVCMGTVNIEVKDLCLEEFMISWQQYFFNSFFSHLLGEYHPARSNIVQLWQGLVNTGAPFPAEELVKTNLTLSHFLK